MQDYPSDANPYRRQFVNRTIALIGTGLCASPLGDLVAYAATAQTTNLAFASAVDVADAIRRGLVSSEEVTREILKRIDKYNPSLNVIVTLVPDEALAQARAADKAMRRGELWGPLHGVPITIKEAIDAAGLRTTGGVPFLADNVSQTDAPPVRHLRTAGAIIIGKTNVPIFSKDWQAYNPIFGTSNNPWDPERTPGGSTGGGAAALAAGLSYLSLGSDRGGSIRVPASFCGVYGHKPSLNLVSYGGYIPPLPDSGPRPLPHLKVMGPLARSAADLKAAISIIGGPREEQAAAYNWSLPPARHARLQDYRVRFVIDDPLCPLTPDVEKVMEEAVLALGRAGVQLQRGWPEGIDAEAQYDTYLQLLADLFSLDAEPPSQTQGSEQQLEGFAARMANAHTRTIKQSHRTELAHLRARAAWRAYFETHDVFLMPTSFVPAFPHDHSEPYTDRKLSTPAGPRPYEDLFFWIAFATLGGLPATTAPVGLTDAGLPVGIQILGPYFDDATSIEFAAGMADVLGGFKPPPGY